MRPPTLPSSLLSIALLAALASACAQQPAGFTTGSLEPSQPAHLAAEELRLDCDRLAGLALEELAAARTLAVAARLESASMPDTLSRLLTRLGDDPAASLVAMERFAKKAERIHRIEEALAGRSCPASGAGTTVEALRRELATVL
jgi:hypothetical protein